MITGFFQSCFLVFFCAGFVSAGISLPKFFTDNMGLQRHRHAAVWGWAKPQEMVQVVFGGQTKSTRADAQGNWKVQLGSPGRGTCSCRKLGQRWAGLDLAVAGWQGEAGCMGAFGTKPLDGRSRRGTFRKQELSATMGQ